MARSRKELEGLMRLTFNMKVDKDITTEDAISAFAMLQLEVLLDIRDIAEGIDRRLGAAAITKVVKKPKK